ncbi:MAG TPA: hypothetical protein VEA61_09405 [Allosphingosinicella sp.]|nr:hypothetical protein [Allosphingosinicella sp.]
MATQASGTVKEIQDEQVWGALYAGFVPRIHRHGTREAAAGFARLGLGPGLEEVASVAVRVRALTGWRLEAVDGMIGDRDFFALLGERRFPVAQEMRGPDEIEFARLPDRFHDIFGHTPLLVDPTYRDFLDGLAAAAGRNLDCPAALRSLARIYWYVIECGLALEGGERRAFGAAILTSSAECDRACAPDADVAPLELEAICAREYDSFGLQPKYFLLGSFADLEGITRELHNRQWGRA